MMRHNYQQSALSHVAGMVPGLPFRSHVRRSLAVFGSALLLTGGLWALEAHRIAALDTDLGRMREEAGSLAREARRSQQLADAVRRSSAIEMRIGEAHRVALDSTNAIARIGNLLPEETWLTNVAATPSGSITIAGRSTRVVEIGATLDAIQHIDARAATRLVSISTTGRTGNLHDFVIAWERDR